MDQSMLKNAAGEIYALNLGADFCAEHEWGIEKLWHMMGVNFAGLELDRYTATVPQDKNLFFFVKKGNVYLTLDGYNSWREQSPDREDSFKKHISETLYLDKEVRKNSDGAPINFSAAWDEGSFGISVRNRKTDKEIFDFVANLITAIKSGDFAVWFGGNAGKNPFARSGLVVAIASKVPQDVRDYMRESHAEQKRLREADFSTGIKALLKEKNKGFYACSASWLRPGQTRLNGGEIKSKHTVYYWLNPADQKDNEFGWFTVEELTDWANDVEGNPVTKKKKVTA